MRDEGGDEADQETRDAETSRHTVGRRQIARHGDLARRPDQAIRSLTEHPLYPAIHGRLVTGISSYRVAAWIRQRVDPDDPLGRRTIRSSLARTLQKYAKLLPKAAFLPQSMIEDLVRGAEIDVDVMQELAGFIVLQKQRVTMAVQMEADPTGNLERD